MDEAPLTRFQFSLRDALVAIAFLSILFAGWAAAGVSGVLLGGVAIFIIAMLKKGGVSWLCYGLAIAGLIWACVSLLGIWVLATDPLPESARHAYHAVAAPMHGVDAGQPVSDFHQYLFLLCMAALGFAAALVCRYLGRRVSAQKNH